ncbi:sensor histidine kinase [Winogradskyella flava]|uniref:sensor histidine kinase n=1 Tax=Winogradskyella flava TaxID=1884876 RepID=UPI0024925578|nr:sensor histidine kinase [Winogradskyella flava]
MQTGNQIVSTEAERYLLIYMIVVLIIIATLVILFFIIFQKRKNKILLDKLKQQQEFEEELAKTQQEIQEETLKHVGRELHDNVGQLLSFATMQMNAAAKVVSEDVKSKVGNASDALKESLAEVRALSKSLNSDVITNLGFEASVKNEIHRLNKSGLIEAQLTINGERINFENKKDEIILFRILQEFFSNTLKYAEAENLNVALDYHTDYLGIEVSDNGVGFDVENAQQGSGMTNMRKRSELIDAEFQLQSEHDKGTVLRMKYPYKII